MEKTVMVTGGSHGVGRGIALTLAHKGYDVALTYHTRQAEAAQVQAKIEAMGRRCCICRSNFEEKDAAFSAVAWAIESLGRLDLMVCNAGATRFSSVLNITNEEIDALFNLNYRSYLLCAREAARHMVRTGIRGSIVFITSSRAERAYPEDMLYGGFKAGIRRACESIALDLAPYGIRANCVAPGATWIDGTEVNRPSALDKAIPLRRMGRASEIGEAVAYLAGDAAGYITGVTLRLDGGLILPGIPEGIADPVAWHNPAWTQAQRTLLDKSVEGGERIG